MVTFVFCLCPPFTIPPSTCIGYTERWGRQRGAPVPNRQSNTTPGAEEPDSLRAAACCRALAERSMLRMNSPWPWGSHQFCMRSTHQIDWGLRCSSGSPAICFRPDTHRDGRDHTDRSLFAHAHACTHTHTRAGLGADNGNSTADQGTPTIVFRRLSLLLLKRNWCSFGFRAKCYTIKFHKEALVSRWMFLCVPA